MVSKSEPDTKTFHNPMKSTSGSISRSTSYAGLKAEKVLQGFGTLGNYQMLICALASVAYFLYACESMLFSLIIKKPEFTCNQHEGYNMTLNQCEYFNLETNSTTKCSRFSYKEGKHAYVTSEFDLVCDNAHYGEYIFSFFMLGSMIFAPILTQLADLYGRRITFLVLLWLTVLANIGCAFAPNYTLLMGLVLLAGISNNGLGTIRYVMILETVAPTFRSYTFLISTLTWMAGHTIAGIVHMWIKTSERFNGVNINLEQCRNPTLTQDGKNPMKDIRKRTFMDILSNGGMTFQLIAHCFIRVIMTFTYWALSIFSTDFHENKMMGYFLAGFVEILGVGAVFLLAYFGRRTVASFGFFAQAVAMCVAVFYPGKNTASMILFLLVKGFNNILWVSEPLLTAEMAPTTTRNIFCGIIGFIGKTGPIIAPYFHRLRTIHEVAPSVALAFLSLTAGLLILCSPETKNVPMPEDVDDFDPGPVYPWIFGHSKKNKIKDIELSDTK